MLYVPYRSHHDAISSGVGVAEAGCCTSTTIPRWPPTLSAATLAGVCDEEASFQWSALHGVL